jgi:hypothetical protein
VLLIMQRNPYHDSNSLPRCPNVHMYPLVGQYDLRHLDLTTETRANPCVRSLQWSTPGRRYGIRQYRYAGAEVATSARQDLHYIWFREVASVEWVKCYMCSEMLPWVASSCNHIVMEHLATHSMESPSSIEVVRCSDLR